MKYFNYCGYCANNHLPSGPSQTEVNGVRISLGEMNAVLLQKIEDIETIINQLNK